MEEGGGSANAEVLLCRKYNCYFYGVCLFDAGLFFVGWWYALPNEWLTTTTTIITIVLVVSTYCICVSIIISSSILIERPFIITTA